MCAGYIVSVSVKWTASWQRWRPAGQQSIWSLWLCCWRTCRSAPRWQVTRTHSALLAKAITHVGQFNSPPCCVCLCFCPSGIYRDLCLESVKHKYDCETQAACQHWEVRNTPCVVCVKDTCGLTCFMSVLLCVCAEWEAVALRHGTKWTGRENKAAGGRSPQHWHHIRWSTESRGITWSYIYTHLILLHPNVCLSELWNDEVSGRKKRRDALSPDKKRRRPSVVSDILQFFIALWLLTVTQTALSKHVLIFPFDCLHAASGTVLNIAHVHISSICCLIWIFWRTGQPSGRCVLSWFYCPRVFACDVTMVG